MESQTSQQQNQLQEQQSGLTAEVALELVTLLKDPKIQVKYGSLNAILQYAKTQQQKELFAGTQLFSQINKVLNNEKLTKICLSTLIHFTSTSSLEKQFVRFVEPLICNLKQWKDDLREELSLLCLLNISKFDSIIEEMINKQQKKGFLLEILYGFMEIKEIRRWVIVNIFVNVSSIQIGRKYVSEQRIYLRFMNYINCDLQTVRLGVLKLLRNVAFQWEVQQFISQILKPQHDLINRLGEHLLYIIQVSNISPQSSEQYLGKILFDYQPLEAESKKIIKNMKISSKQKAFGQIWLILDTLLVLSNSNFAQRKVEVKQNPLRQVLSILKFTEMPEQYKDKIQALQIFCFS